MQRVSNFLAQIYRKLIKATRNATLTQITFLLVAIALLLTLGVEIGHIVHTYWQLKRAARETIEWAITYQPIQGEHLDGSACTNEEKCYNETEEEYLARRARLIKAMAIAKATGKPLSEGPSVLQLLESAPFNIEIWGFPSFSAPEVQNHPGIPGLPIRIRIVQKVETLTPMLGSMLPALQLTITEERINEGIHIGWANVAPPVFDSIQTPQETPNIGTTGRTAYSQPLIIKEAKLQLRTENTETALRDIAQITEELEGYIVRQQTWYDGEAKVATITITIPATDFENALAKLRRLAIQVVNEEIAGKDVTEQYIDIEARLRNQQATKDRVFNFLEQAETVREALMVSQELSRIEEQIEQLQGQLNHLTDQIDFARITINLTMATGETQLAPTWKPGSIIQQALNTLTTILQTLVGIVIWSVIVFVPLGLLVYLLLRSGISLSKYLREKAPPKQKSL